MKEEKEKENVRWGVVPAVGHGSRAVLVYLIKVKIGIGAVIKMSNIGFTRHNGYSLFHHL
jgi:hypothetical protein